jgi:hypothetical protein
MTGGSATHAGIGFQDKVAGLLSVHVLADAPVDVVGVPSSVTPTSIELETSAPVDGVLVATSAGGFCFINVKKASEQSHQVVAVSGSMPCPEPVRWPVVQSEHCRTARSVVGPVPRRWA